MKGEDKKVVVFIQVLGGVVSQVVANQKGVEFVVCDFDTQGLDDSQIVRMRGSPKEHRFDGTQAHRRKAEFSRGIVERHAEAMQKLG